MASERSSATPRIATGNCSVGLASTSSSSNGGNSSDGHATAIYDKQMAWKLHGQRKIQSKSHEISSRDELECTFTPKTNNNSKRRQLTSDGHASSPRESPSHSPIDGFTSSGSPPTSVSISIAAPPQQQRSPRAAPVFPTESQESSIQLHLVRQERAREHALDAHHRLFATAQRSKDFTRVTTVEPFKLSVGNQKQRASSASPTKIREPSITAATAVGSSSIDSAAVPVRAVPRTKRFKKVPSSSAIASNTTTLVTTTGAASASGTGAVNHQSQQQQQQQQQQQELSSLPFESREDAWDRERASLVALLDAQRRELEQRDQAQHDAMQVAATFAAAIERFEERLVVVESTTALELARVRELLQQQAAATELILQSLGIAQLLPATAAAPLPTVPSTWSSESPHPETSSSVMRRETK